MGYSPRVESITRRNALAVGLAGALIASRAVGAGAQPVAPADLAAEEGTARRERLVAGARREGSVTIYSSMPVEDMRAQTEAFERLFGVGVQAWRASGETVVQRTVAEARAGRFAVDLVESTGPDLEALRGEGVLAPLTIPSAGRLHPDARPAHRAYVGTRFLVEALAFNTALVARDELPRRWEDLRNSRWRGKLGITNDAAPWLAALATALGGESGLQLVREIFAVNGVSVRRGHSLLANLVAAGEVPLALNVYDYRAEQLKRAGAPVDTIYLDPTPANIAGIGVAGRAAHPHAAQLFMDFALNEGLSILRGRGFRTTEGAESLPAGIRIAMNDNADVVANNALWQQRLRAVIGQ